MLKKYLPIIIIVFIVLATIIGTSIYYFVNNSDSNIPDEDIIIGNNEDENLELPTKGNDTVIITKADTTLRVINEYDVNFFTAEKNLLIMFGSWCPNCQEEISEIEEILNYYKNNKKVNIVLIAHEFDDTVTDLIDLLENDVNFGVAEVKIDLKRIIRKTIDPEASTIPISYVVDKKGNILESYNDSLTLEKAIEMVEK